MSTIHYLHPRRPALIDVTLLEADRDSISAHNRILDTIRFIRRMQSTERRELDARVATTNAAIASRDWSYHRRRQWDFDNRMRAKSCEFCKGTGELATCVNGEYEVEDCPKCQRANPWLPKDDGIPF